MKRSIGLDSGPSGKAGRTTGFNDHQTSALALLVWVAPPVKIEAQRQIIQSNCRAGMLWITRLVDHLLTKWSMGNIYCFAE